VHEFVREKKDRKKRLTTHRGPMGAANVGLIVDKHDKEGEEKGLLRREED